jgi:hypothetical protein
MRLRTFGSDLLLITNYGTSVQLQDAASASYSLGEDGSTSRNTDVRLLVSVDCGQDDAASCFEGRVRELGE